MRVCAPRRTSLTFTRRRPALPRLRTHRHPRPQRSARARTPRQHHARPRWRCPRETILPTFFAGASAARRSRPPSAGLDELEAAFTRTSPIPSSGGAREAANRPPELSHPHLRVPQPSVGRRSAHRPHSPQTREPVHGGAHKGTNALRRCWPSAWAKRGSSPRPGRASTGAQPPWRLRSRAWTAPCPGL